MAGEPERRRRGRWIGRSGRFGHDGDGSPTTPPVADPTPVRRSSDEPAAWAEEGDGPRSTVWMVSLRTGLQGRKGILFMDARTLVFRPDSTRYGDTRIHIEHVQRVKPARLTPVLDVRLSAPDLPARMGFYFVEPPDLEPVEQAGIRLSSPRRQARREAASMLREANPLIREDLLGWVRRIQTAQRSR